jgi:hypothetical protein
VPSFLIESYSSADPADLSDAVARAQRAGQVAGGVSYVRTTHLPSDETCLHLFHAPSSAALGEAARQAGLGHLRIVEAVETAAAPEREANS